MQLLFNSLRLIDMGTLCIWFQRASTYLSYLTNHRCRCRILLAVLCGGSLTVPTQPGVSTRKEGDFSTYQVKDTGVGDEPHTIHPVFGKIHRPAVVDESLCNFEEPSSA